MNLKTKTLSLLAVVGLVVGLGACGDDGDDPVAQSGTTEGPTSVSSDATDGGDASSTTEAATEPLDILVTNDDSYSAAGIDVLVQALVDTGATVTVVAPLEQQSGQGGTFTEGAVESQQEETTSGYPALAVDGFPADSVRVAIDEMEMTPDLVVSGINEGQNTGALVDVSGTIGAARAAVARGVPALALSAGAAAEGGSFETGYALGAELAVAWVEEHAAALLAGDAPVEVTSINVPSCGDGQAKELVEVPVSTEANLDPADCSSTVEDPADDVTALAAGYPTLTVVPDEPVTPPQPG